MHCETQIEQLFNSQQKTQLERSSAHKQTPHEFYKIIGYKETNATGSWELTC